MFNKFKICVNWLGSLDYQFFLLFSLIYFLNEMDEYNFI